MTGNPVIDYRGCGHSGQKTREKEMLENFKSHMKLREKHGYDKDMETDNEHSSNT